MLSNARYRWHRSVTPYQRPFSVDFTTLFSCISRKLVTVSEFDLKMAADGKCYKLRERVSLFHAHAQMTIKAKRDLRLLAVPFWTIQRSAISHAFSTIQKGTASSLA